MDVRERDWGELPGGLSFTELEPPPPPPPARPRLRRAVQWVVVLALLGTAGLVGVRWTGEQDVRDVLASSTATYDRVLGIVATARDPEALASAAALAPRAAQRLDADLARLTGTGGDRRAAVAGQVAAEREVLLALAPLERLADGPLAVWARAHQPLTTAVAAEMAARAALRAVDDDAARELPDTPAVLRQLASTVGAALVDDVQRSAGQLLDDLAEAQRTADLRETAARAAAQRAAVDAAQGGLGDGGDATVLREFVAALDAARDLQLVTPADTASWPGIRGRLSERLRFVADSDDSLAAGSVRARLPLVLTAVDGLVARAEEAHAAWQRAHDAAVGQQAADRDALQRYGDAVRATGQEWTRLRADVAAVLQRPATPVAAAVLELAALSATADRVLAALQAALPPPGTEAAHARLVGSAEVLAGTLVPVLDELRADVCPDCPVDGTAAWRSLGRGSAAAGSWDEAFTAWETAVSDADAAVTARPLPPPPDA